MKFLPWKLSVQRRPPTGWRGEVNSRLDNLAQTLEEVRKMAEATRRKVYRDDQEVEVSAILKEREPAPPQPRAYRTGDLAPGG